MEISRVLNYVDEAPRWVGSGREETREPPQLQQQPPQQQLPTPPADIRPSPDSTNHFSSPSCSAEEPSPRTTTHTALNPAPPHPILRNKRPIPRQAGRGYAPKSRAALACNSCRQGKFKCTGEKNQCQRCAMLGKQCWYPAHKRERIQREMDQLVTEANEYRLMLELLLSRVNKEDAEDISALLFKYEK
ncbi:Zn(II)2Cys6 transcription factor domain-containing protein [Aspergillus saccharolyticus JOP 1030-1]|uniref:Zn(2)-C6 fungal-type domain-containing protein n=1 Tax=Aspergillus saccharolyticus JOP 1030-1 TaxID=1450539 RepID=A0A318Z6H5_9EURO|nr:hypothetical protein BP01DRAFT_359115 [Aspergillus saccharolyticus JOP 1030-1]PYH42885.1 hypothetical protein BP01DRAFT_359115 [Aspergillus saccharolyticus JOP 1030-1]